VATLSSQMRGALMLGTGPKRLRLDERGSSMVEFTIVASLLFMLLFGIVEFGLAFRDRLTVTNATQGSARVVSALGDDPNADYQMLLSLEQSLGILPGQAVGIVRYVDVYLADANGDPAGSCSTGGGDRCNRYVWAPTGGTCDWNPCPDADNGYGSWPWSPASRDVQLPGLDVIAVRVTYAHAWVTGGLVPLPDVTCNGNPGSGCWADTAVMRLEPQVFES
jgi:TadE-like protein